MPIIPPEHYCDEIPDDFTLGVTKAEIQISNVEENRQAVLSLASQARYGINIFTQDMDDALFNNEEFENHVYQLAVHHPNAQIRILVQNSTPAVKKGHRLIRIAQKLTSSVFIRKPPEELKKDKSAFLTVDGVGMSYRLQADSYNHDASVNFMSPRRVKKLDEFFNEAWQQSVRDPKVRRLFV